MDYNIYMVYDILLGVRGKICVVGEIYKSTQVFDVFLKVGNFTVLDINLHILRKF